MNKNEMIATLLGAFAMNNEDFLNSVIEEMADLCGADATGHAYCVAKKIWDRG